MAGIIGFILAVLAFVITWNVSTFFIPPRDHWSKSAYAVFVVKLGMAATAALVTLMYASVFFQIL